MSLRALLSLPLFLVCGACNPDDGKTTSDSSTAATEPTTGTSETSTGEPTGATTTTDPTGSESGSTGVTSEPPTSGGDSGSSTGEPSKPDPDFVRECQPDDFKCEDFGCNNGDSVKLSECYKPCTPSVVGEPDDECDEPERPFCSQVGQADGGDFDCNSCWHICVAEPIDQCNQAVDACP